LHHRLEFADEQVLAEPDCGAVELIFRCFA